MSGTKWRRLAWRPLLPPAGAGASEGPGPGPRPGREAKRSETKRKAGRGRAAGRAAAGPCLSAAGGERRVGGSGGATARRGPVPCQPPVPPPALACVCWARSPVPHDGRGSSRPLGAAALGLYVPARCRCLPTLRAAATRPLRGRLRSRRSPGPVLAPVCASAPLSGAAVSPEPGGPVFVEPPRCARGRAAAAPWNKPSVTATVSGGFRC